MLQLKISFHNQLLGAADDEIITHWTHEFIKTSQQRRGINLGVWIENWMFMWFFYKKNESGFRPYLRTYRLSWVRKLCEKHCIYNSVYSVISGVEPPTVILRGLSATKSEIIFGMVTMTILRALDISSFVYLYVTVYEYYK